jgi:hypothetical protein
MKSWSEWFENRAEGRKRDAKRPIGFYMTDEGPISLGEAARRGEPIGIYNWKDGNR